ncbi:MAG: hypothetical protein EOO20_24095, partial [Chryseobacterium sp.]
MISSKPHALLDYLVGILLIAAPWLLGFADSTAATVIPIVLGASTLVYSLFTNYEYGIVRVLPYKIHLTIDFIAGLLLLVSPWLFGFSDRIYLPHVILGAFEIVAVLLSRRATATAGLRTVQTRSSG